MADVTVLAGEVDRKLPDVPSSWGFATADREQAVRDAFTEFLTFGRFDTVQEDIAGSGVFDLTLPASFDVDESILTSVEYPAGQREPCILNPATYLIYNDGGTYVLRLLSHIPQAGETVRIDYTVPYTIATIPTGVAPQYSVEEVGIIWLAASLYAEAIAGWASKTSNASISLDSTDHTRQEEMYRMRAARFRDLAYGVLGIELPAGADGRQRGHGGGGTGGGLASATSASGVTVQYLPTR